MNELIRIESSYFVAGIIIQKPYNVTATILSYMKTWNKLKNINYCKNKKWKFSEYKGDLLTI